MVLLERLRIQLPEETNTALLLDVLESAKYAILNQRYPFGVFPLDAFQEPILEARYNDTQCRIALFLYNKRGAEGQTGHNENGINRSYEAADIPPSMLSGVIPRSKGVTI